MSTVQDTTLPRDILDRVERVQEYHRSSKLTEASAQASADEIGSSNRPSLYRSFDPLPKTALPTTLLDASIATMALLNAGLDAVPESQLDPPQNLKTLATLLYLAYGVTQKVQEGETTLWLRSCPSNGGMYPGEIYVAAMGIEGLEPGLYHYSPRDFSLRKLREGHATLSQIKRGRPDLDYLKNVPAALFVSTIFCRSAWKFGRRGYRCAMEDAGHLVQNIVTAATGLGITAQVRLRMNENTMRELIGLPANADFEHAESVQAMIVWNNPARTPLPLRSVAPGAVPAPLGPIHRQALSSGPLTSFATILAVHEDCVAPGVAVREISPPMTDLTPIPPHVLPTAVTLVEEPHGGEPLSTLLLKHKPPRNFARQGIARELFLAINQVAFRGGAHWPLMPQGRYASLVRPMWMIHDVVGLDEGVWYYHPPNDQWTVLSRGVFRIEAQYLAQDLAPAGDASAVCFMIANFNMLLAHAGPDPYRLAHLEAGIIAQRMTLAADSTGLGCVTIPSFYDEEIRKFLGMNNTGWEVLYAAAIGVPLDGERKLDEEPQFKDDDWRD